MVNYVNFKIIRTEFGGRVIKDGTVALPSTVIVNFFKCQATLKLISCLISTPGS